MKKQQTQQTQQTQALAKIELDGGWLPQPKTIDEAMSLARVFADSGMVPEHYVGKPAAVLVAIQKGAELGLSPMFALQNIAVIRGRPCIWGDAALALIKSDPRCDDVIEVLHRDKAGVAIMGECTVLRRGKKPVTRTFSTADAKVADLWSKKGPWQQYPWRMLQLRARGFALRDSFPDRLAGLPIAEEVRDYPDDMVVDARLEPQEGHYSARKPAQEATPAPEPPANTDAEIAAILSELGEASGEQLDALAERARRIPVDRRGPVRKAWTERRAWLDAQTPAPAEVETAPPEPEPPAKEQPAQNGFESPKAAELFAAATATKTQAERLTLAERVNSSDMSTKDKRTINDEIDRRHMEQTKETAQREMAGF